MSYRDVSYSRSRSRSPRGSDREFRPRTKELDSAPKVFVGNLSHDTEESEFRAHFDHCGKIVEILMPRDPHTSRSKGYGFITFEDFDSMDKAINKMDQSLLLGNALKVARANERKERPKFPDDRRGGGYGGGSYNGSYDRGGSYGRGGGGYDRGGGSYDRGGHNSYDRDRGRDYDRGSGYKSGGYEDRGAVAVKKAVGYRCRIAGLAREIGWQLLKDFLRQAGDVTYANVDPDGLGVGEYATLEECRDAIDKLTGAALDGHIVKLTPLNFDWETGERLDRPSSRSYENGSRGGNPFDFSSATRPSRPAYNGTGGGSSGSGFIQRSGGYSNGYSRGGDRGGSSSYDRDERGHGGVVYSNAHNAPGSSSRYGGGGGGNGWTGSSSKYGGGSSRYGGGGDDGYRGGGGPDRSHTRSGSDERRGPYDRPSGSR